MEILIIFCTLVVIGVIIKSKNSIMATLDEQLDAISTQLTKAKDEILTKISDLENAQGKLTPDQQAKLDLLKTTVQTLDDIVPDVTEPPVEPTEPTL